MIDSVTELFTCMEQRLDNQLKHYPEHHIYPEISSDWVKQMSKEAQVFDCSGISPQVIGDGSFEHQMYPYNETPPSIDARLPSPVCILAFKINKKSDFFDKANIKEGHTKKSIAIYGNKTIEELAGNHYYLCKQIDDDPSHFEIWSLSHGHNPPRFGIVGGEKNWEVDLSLQLHAQSKGDDIRNPDNRFLSAVSGSLRRVCCLLQTINTPRHVLTGLGGTRQARRSAHRGMGFAMDAWHRVSWDVSKPVNAKEPYDIHFHKLPLHFRRGHWRKGAEEHHPRSVLRNNQWQTWIEGYWAGHPAFGFKKQYWTPKAE